MTDLVVVHNPATLERVRRVYPLAVGYGRSTGARFQTVRELRLRERRGDIAPVWRFAKNVRPGVIEIPFVMLRTPAQARMRRVRNGALLAGVAIGAAVGVGALLWMSRYVIGGAVGTAAALALVLRFGPHWFQGCPGLHCAGCRG